MNKNLIYTGSRAQRTLRKLLESSDFSSGPKITGYYLEKDKWIAFDNRDGECYVEEFKTRAEVMNWIKR